MTACADRPIPFLCSTLPKESFLTTYCTEDSAVSEITCHLQRLAALACPDGAWGYAPDQAAHLEPTCLALLALSLDSEHFPEAMARGKSWLSQCKMPDGTYRIANGREEATWPTALVLFTQTILGESTQEL